MRLRPRVIVTRIGGHFRYAVVGPFNETLGQGNRATAAEAEAAGNAIRDAAPAIKLLPNERIPSRRWR